MLQVEVKEVNLMLDLIRSFPDVTNEFSLITGDLVVEYLQNLGIEPDNIVFGPIKIYCYRTEKIKSKLENK